MQSENMKTKAKSKSKWRKFREIGLRQYEPSRQFFAEIRVGGILNRKKLHTDNYDVARRKLRDYRNDLERTDATKGNKSFGAVLDDYANTFGHLASRKDKLAIIKKLKDTFFGVDSVPLRLIKPSQVGAWLSKHYGHLSASAYNSALTVVRDSLNLALRDKIIAESPAAHLEYRKREKPIRLTPTFDQFQMIVANIRAQRLNKQAEQSADFLAFIGLAGLGQAEVRAITRADIDLEGGQIVTFRHKTRQGFVVPIFPQLRPLIEKLCNGKASGERLFKQQDAAKALTNACRRLGLPPFSHRSFRRMFITRAIEKGVDVKVIADWQGHRDGGKLILQTYSHVRPIHSQRMAQLMTTEEPGNVIPMSEAAAVT